MKIVTRPGTMNDKPALFAYRPRERRQSLGGHAWETPSGKWIVSLPAMPLDVVDTMEQAEVMMHAHFKGRADVY